MEWNAEHWLVLVCGIRKESGKEKKILNLILLLNFAKKKKKKSWKDKLKRRNGNCFISSFYVPLLIYISP